MSQAYVQIYEYMSHPEYVISINSLKPLSLSVCLNLSIPPPPTQSFGNKVLNSVTICNQLLKSSADIVFLPTFFLSPFLLPILLIWFKSRRT